MAAHWNIVPYLSTPQSRKTACYTNTILHNSLKDKVKVVPLFFNWASRHERVLGEWRYSFTHSLTSARGGGEWSASRLDRFTPREGSPGTHWIRAWVDPRAVLDAVVKRKIPSPRRKSNLKTPIVKSVAQSLYHWLSYHSSFITHCVFYLYNFRNTH
jgi:hypothetical protein